MLSPGTKLGPYEILAPIGAGGMGEVWKARDTRLGRIVAIKQVKEQHSERFKQEARSIAALNHQNICQIHDIGSDYFFSQHVHLIINSLLNPLDSSRKAQIRFFRSASLPQLTKQIPTRAGWELQNQPATRAARGPRATRSRSPGSAGRRSGTGARRS